MATNLISSDEDTDEDSNVFILDQHIASEDFIDRLCLVPTPVPGTPAELANSAAGNEANFVATHKLWPALKFESCEELMIMVTSLAHTSSERKIWQAKILLTYRRVLKEAKASAALYPNNAAEVGVAYLLGRFAERGNCQGSLVLLNGGNVFSFYVHFCEMEEAQGHCGTKEFKHAYAVAISRLEVELGKGAKRKVA